MLGVAPLQSMGEYASAVAIGGRTFCSYGYRPTHITLMGTPYAIIIKPLVVQSNLSPRPNGSSFEIKLSLAFMRWYLMLEEIVVTFELSTLSLCLGGILEMPPRRR